LTANDANPDMLLSTSEAANYLRIAESKLSRMRKDGIGPTYVVQGDPKNGAVFYRKRDLDAWLAAVVGGAPIRSGGRSSS
jgi:hypothetical protein